MWKLSTVPHVRSTGASALLGAAVLTLILGILMTGCGKKGSEPEPFQYWELVLGGTGADLCMSLTRTTDGYIAGAGYSAPPGSLEYDAHVYKLDDAGELIWEKRFGGFHMDGANAVVAHPDGGLLVAGYTAVFVEGLGQQQAWLFRLNPDGGKAWERTYGGEGDEVAMCLARSSSGSMVIAGWKTSESGGSSRDIYVAKLDDTGAVIFEKSFGGSEDDYATCLAALPNGELVIGGVTRSSGNGGQDAFLLRLDHEGNELSFQEYGGQKDDGFNFIAPVEDGGLRAVGFSRSCCVGGNDAWYVLLNSSGGIDQEWNYGTTGDEAAFSLIPSLDSGFVFVGSGPLGMYINKVGPSGHRVWSTSLNRAQVGTSVLTSIDGGYIIGGRRGADAYLVKVDDIGEFVSSDNP